MTGRIRRKIKTFSADQKSNKSNPLGSHYKIRTEKTGHYFTHGTITDKTRFIWVGLHGYGQLAKYFIQKFEFLDPQQHYVVVPEGLNRFYFEGVNERPVASWMTREDRLDEIADYVEFLELLRKKLGWDKNPDVQIIYLGFSQGVSTLIRWLSNRHPPCDHLLLWAGMMPDDILLEHHRLYFGSFPSYYFIGKTDPYFNKDRFKEIELLTLKAGLKAQVQWFDGNHTVDETALKQWVQNQLLRSID
jgi:predicted esterase